MKYIILNNFYISGTDVQYNKGDVVEFDDKTAKALAEIIEQKFPDEAPFFEMLKTNSKGDKE